MVDIISVSVTMSVLESLRKRIGYEKKTLKQILIDNFRDENSVTGIADNLLFCVIPPESESFEVSFCSLINEDDEETSIEKANRICFDGDDYDEEVDLSIEATINIAPPGSITLANGTEIIISKIVYVNLI